ncbi:J domain-containing protein [Desulfatiferula olefinivorans]
MLTTLSSADFLRACQILFSPDIPFSPSFVNTLDPSVLKTAFRKKALETHPDRARALGRAEADQSRMFQEVKRAYEALLPVAEKTVTVDAGAGVRRGHPGAATRPRPRPGNGPVRSAAGSYYRGILPGQRLKLGQYLYYSGVITWRHLIDAISWQRRIRPRYGQIALDWNIITAHDVVQILQNRARGERFGEYARREGFVSGFQHMAIMGKQNRFHRRFGDYFVVHGLLSERQVEILVRRAMQHNQMHG